MPATTILTHYERLRKARATNQTSASFVSKVPVGSIPTTVDSATGASIFTAGYLGAQCQNGMKIFPYGVGSNNNTFNMRVIGWEVVDLGLPTELWVPGILVEVQNTLSSNIPGLANRAVIATEFFADTMTLVGTTGNANISCEIFSPADDANMAHLMLDIKGCALVEVTFSISSGSTTSMNALLKML